MIMSCPEWLAQRPDESEVLVQYLTLRQSTHQECPRKSRDALEKWREEKTKAEKGQRTKMLKHEVRIKVNAEAINLYNKGNNYHYCDCC